MAGSSGAKAPSGIDAADRVARTHATGASVRAAASAASRVFPTPAGPAMTTPPAAASASSAAISRSSASRPARGNGIAGV